MCLQKKLWFTLILQCIVFDGVLPHEGGDNRRSSYVGDLDPGREKYSTEDEVPYYEYKVSNPPRYPTFQDFRPTVSPRKEVSHKLYKGRIKATILDQSRTRDQQNQRLRHRSSPQEYRQFTHDQPPSPRQKSRVCARCPGDRAVLTTKGSNSVLMDTPPIIPCYPWSRVDKVKVEVIAGPQPGFKISEGSHKMALRIYRRKRTLATCVIRYNVIVRKCPELELNPEVKAECPLGKAWGSKCNLTCEPGYLLEGDSSTECSDDLEWTGVQPQCVLSTACPAPVSPEHGQLSCRTPQHLPAVSLQKGSTLPDGTVCQFRCDPGYEVPPEQSHLTRVRCIGGSWDSDQDPICVDNQLEEEEEENPDISTEEDLRLDVKNCSDNICANGGKCVQILDEKLCSCQPGFSGHHCEYSNSYLDSSTDTEDNTIT